MTQLDELRAVLDGGMVALRARCERAGTPISCSIACCGCCRGEVGVWKEEAERVMAALPPRAFERLDAQGPSADPRTAICPALDPDARLCSIYSERPLGCRAYAVVSPPELCHPEVSGTSSVHIVADPIVALGEAMGRGPDLSLRDLMKYGLPC